MLVTLCASALRSRMKGHGSGNLTVVDLPRVARDELGLSGMVMPTELLVGADRQLLTKILESADKVQCPCLVLIESKPLQLAAARDADAAIAVDRCQRVAQAAAWLGCSAFSLKVEAEDTDDRLMLAALNLKPVSRRSEKLELNLCLQPHPGLTANPERLTELLKKIGGFRVGTLPTFTGALASDDPMGYMRRLAPYASAILVQADGLAGSPTEKVAPKKRTAAKAKPPKVKTKAQMAADPDSVPPPLPPVPEMTGNVATRDLVDVLLAVGFDGPLALDFVGSGDPIPALIAMRDTIYKAVGRPDADAEPDLDLDLPEAEAASEVDDEGEK